MKKKARNRDKAAQDKSRSEINRRAFVKMLPAAGASAMAATRIDVAAAITKPLQQAQPPQPPQRVTKEMLHDAEQLIGVDLTPAQEDMALPGVNRNLAAYE